MRHIGKVTWFMVGVGIGMGWPSGNWRWVLIGGVIHGISELIPISEEAKQ